MFKYIALLLQFLPLLPSTFSYSALPVTNPRRSDGFGSQYQTIVYSMIFAELNGKPFLYTPIQSMEHNYDGDPSFFERMEALMNLKDHYPNNTNLGLQKDNVHDFINYFQAHMDESMNSQALKQIKALFRSNKACENYFQNDRYNIAIHIRRQNAHDPATDVTRSSTPDSLYVSIIDQLRKEYKDQNPVFHIISQGDVEAFRKTYLGDDIVFHIDSSIEESFTMLVLADCLVMSTSSFSYIASVLSDGVIYYVPFWSPPLPGWNVVDYCTLNNNR